jgi:hypothetical protein
VTSRKKLLRHACYACLTLLVFLVCACGSKPPTAKVVPQEGANGLPGSASPADLSFHPIGYFSYEPPLLPIEFEVSTDGTFSVQLAFGVATALGDFHASGGAEGSMVSDSTGQPVPVQTVGVTQLFVCKAGGNRQTCEGYAIRTGRKVSILLNGQFQETIDNGVVTIDASPGARITVKDAGEPVTSGPRPAARIDIEDWAFTPDGPYTEVDMEASQGGVTNDLAYDHVTGALYGINGTMLAFVQDLDAGKDWLGDYVMPNVDPPGEDQCSQIPPSQWHTALTAQQMTSDIVVACVYTAQQDFGYLVIGEDPTTKPISRYIYSYTWVR